MTMARRDIVGEEGARGVFHCIVRCVRRSFLCGNDAYSGRNYDHRKEWIRERLSLLSAAFGVEVLTYSVMSNHMHLVLSVRPDSVALWSDDEVAHRWLSVYLPQHINENREKVYEVRQRDIDSLLENPVRLLKIRQRLSSLSWYMKALNEHISRRSNKEDGCKGRFWESRFKCQRLVDEASILACMCYVDLNPVRAKVAEGLEDSVFTGAYERTTALKANGKSDGTADVRIQSENNLAATIARRNELVDLNGSDTPFSMLNELGYLKLLDWTGRQIRSGKPGYIRPEVRSLLEGIDLNADEWVASVTRYNSLFGSIVGHVDQLQKVAVQTGRRWLKGCRKADAMFRPPGKVTQTA